MISTYFLDEVVDVSYRSDDADSTCKNWLKQAKKRIESTAIRAKKMNLDLDKETESEEQSAREKSEQADKKNEDTDDEHASEKESDDDI